MASAAVAQAPGPMQSGTHAPVSAPGKSANAPAPGGAGEGLDVNQLFATTCGWCHLKGGREAGKGPKLMGTPLSDAELISKIKRGKTGEMPAFGSTFTDQQLKAIVAYIRELKP